MQVYHVFGNTKMICCIGFGTYEGGGGNGDEEENWKRREKNTAMEYNINCMFKSHGSISFLEAIKMCRLYHRINLYNNNNTKTLWWVQISAITYTLVYDSHTNITINSHHRKNCMIVFSEKWIALVLCFMNLSNFSIFSIQHICDCKIE